MIASKISRRSVLIVVMGCVLLAALGLWLRAQRGIIVEVHTDALAADSQETGAVEFTIATYNVQARPVLDNSRHKFKYISPLLNQFDICAIQECFKDHRRLWQEARHPVKIYHASLKHPFELVSSGLSILGNFPLQDVAETHFADEGDAQNWPASKGVLKATFDMNGMMLDVYTTHIAAGSKPASRRARFTQGDALIQFIHENSPSDHSFIVLGDFNMRPSRGAEDKEKNKDNPKVMGFDHLVEALNVEDASDIINGPTGTEIDRVLFRAGEGHHLQVLGWERGDPAFVDPEGKALSDHVPVSVRFRLSLDESL